MNEQIVITKIDAMMFHVSCNGIGVTVPRWRIDEKLIRRVIRMCQDAHGVGR